MSKRKFFLLAFFMSVSLIGIIGVQVSFLCKSIETNREKKILTIIESLRKVSDRIQQKEKTFYDEQLQMLRSKISQSSKKELNFVYEEGNNTDNSKFIYSQKYLIEQIDVPLSQVDPRNLDTLSIINVFGGGNFLTIEQKKGNRPKHTMPLTPDLYASIKDNTISLDRFVLIQGNATPIHRRVSINELTKMIREELKYHNIDSEFQFGIFSNRLITRVKSQFFKLKGNEFKVPLFIDERGKTRYELLVNIDDIQELSFSGLWPIIILSLLFTIIIIVSYLSALFFLRKQKKISQMRSDFINNLTHEFKTPIATINLAVDAIKNPIILSDGKKIVKYAQIIKGENMRMNKQVENVLQISLLEKEQIKLQKEKININDLVLETIDHVRLIVENRNGTIFDHLSKENLIAKVDPFHMQNVVINILENANKYSPNEPNITVKTSSSNDHVIISISDKGLGMTKYEQKNIFDKFYRTYTGDVHNIKGHGLGLAYVKSTMELHGGVVRLESEKGKGSTFVLKIPKT